jgi:hypothetical protein
MERRAMERRAMERRAMGRRAMGRRARSPPQVLSRLFARFKQVLCQASVAGCLFA